MKTITLNTILAALFLAFCPFTSAQNKSPIFVAAPGSPISIQGGPANISLADMNIDGKVDLVVACGQGRTISILLGSGNGSFVLAQKSPFPVSASPGEMAVGDINSDGKPDIAFADHDSYGVTLLLGDGKGTFVPAQNSPFVMRDGTAPHTHGLEMGDLNGDGIFDLITVNNNNNDISVALGDGKANFVRASRSPFAVGQSPYPPALGDLNQDGHLDIVATTTMTGPSVSRTATSSKALTILFGDGRGDFRRADIPLRTREPWCVGIADVNGDSKPDIICTHRESSPLTVLLGEGGGKFIEAKESPFDLGRSAWRVNLVDVNGDGKPDVVAAAGTGVRVMLGDGLGSFSPELNSPYATGSGTWRLAVGDVNGDRKTDVVTSNLESSTVTVLLGR
ncbi:MAG: VCBS repeat-containing protein [Ignavibacteriales bacterium]|nr:VCBS repeat-containing protein [Ignavibacteriales bacterium]